MKRPRGVAQPTGLAIAPTKGDRTVFINLYVSGFAIRKKTSVL
jgi:hypothetical protein